MNKFARKATPQYVGRRRSEHLSSLRAILVFFGFFLANACSAQSHPPSGCPLQFEKMEIAQDLTNRAATEVLLQDFAAACATQREIAELYDEVREIYDGCGWQSGAIQMQPLIRLALNSRHNYCEQAKKATAEDDTPSSPAKGKRKKKNVDPPPVEVIEEN